jgi:hypothetical protein
MSRFQKIREAVAEDFSRNSVIYWNHLSRFTNLLIPCNCLQRLEYYLLFVVGEIIACYFIVASVLFWIRTSRA